VNADALNDLSDAHREALLGSVEEALDHYIENYNSNTMVAWGPALDDREIERISYTDDELAAFRETVAGPAAAAWIADNTKRGLPAQELYDTATKLIADYE